MFWYKKKNCTLKVKFDPRNQLIYLLKPDILHNLFFDLNYLQCRLYRNIIKIHTKYFIVPKGDHLNLGLIFSVKSLSIVIFYGGINDYVTIGTNFCR